MSHIAPSNKRTICVVTGTRADYGLLEPILENLKTAEDFKLQIVATGMHLSPAFGSTWREIEAGGYQISEKVESLLSSDTTVGVTKSMGLGTIGMADAFARLDPDLVMLLGDRFEILAAAQAALIARIPVAHLHGGDTTEGAMDEAIRHAVTKMSHLHFVSTSSARSRVIQLGENPDFVHLVGSTGIDQIRKLNPISRQQLERDLGIDFGSCIVLVTFHPVTLEHATGKAQVRELIKALKDLGDEYTIIITGTNSDVDGNEIAQTLAEYAQQRPGQVVLHESLGYRTYLSLMKIASVVVGNSSSGLLEAPSFGVPTVNIGDRQKGRQRASSVLDIPPDALSISQAIDSALAGDYSATVNPYGDGESADRILDILRSTGDYSRLLKKHFHQI